MSASVNLSAEKRPGKNYKNFREMQESNDDKYPRGMENDQKTLNFTMKTQAKNISTQTHRCLEDDFCFCEPENSSSVLVLPLPLPLSNTLLSPHHINFGNSKNNLYRGKHSDSVCQESCSRCEFNDSTFSAIDVENKPHSSLSSPSVSSSALPSTSLPLLSSSPTNCCYTISSHSKDRPLIQENIYGLSNKINKEQTSPREYFTPRYEISSGKSEEIEQNKSFVIDKPTKSKTSPPPVPPKPLKKKHICSTYNYSNEIPKILQSEKIHNDTASFRRKLHKFEKQNTSIGKFKNNVTGVSDVENDQDDERCEFLACFSTSKNVHLDQSVSDNSCVGANEHLFVSECEQDCDIVYTSIEGINNSINIIKKNNNFDVTSKEFSSILSNHQCLGKPDKKIFRYDSFGRLKNIETSASLVNCTDSINTNSLNEIDLEKPSPSFNCSASTGESVTIPNSVVIRNLTPKFNRERHLRANEKYSRRCASDDSLDSRIQFFFEKEKVLNNYIDQRNTHFDYQKISSSVLSGSVLASASSETETGLNINRCKYHYQHLLPNCQKKTRNEENNKIFKSFSDTNNANPAKCLTSDKVIGAHRNLGSLFHSASAINEPNCEVSLKIVNRSLNDIAKKKNYDDRKNSSADQCYAKNDKFNLENYIYDKDADCYNNSSDGSYCHSSVDEYSCCSELSNLRNRIDTTESLSENSSSSCLSQNFSLPIVRGPLVLKRIPATKSFEYASSSHMPAVTCKEIKMDKHRNTLDRWQRLGFGRRSSPTTNQERANKSLDKSERLKELTELLRKNRSSPTPPPVPPPRKSRHINSAGSSLHNTNNPVLLHLPTQTDDIRLIDQDEQHVSKTNITTSTTDQKARSLDDDMLYNKKNNDSNINNIRNNDTKFFLPSDKRKVCESLKPNMSLSNIETLLTLRKKSKSPPLNQTKVDCEIPINLPRPESRIVIGSYARKGIPFRSASFSQIDYSSGKYIGGTLNTLRDRLRREKLPENNSHQSLLLNKDDVRSWQNGKENKTEETAIHIPLKTEAVTSPDDQDKTTTDVIQETNLLYKERKQGLQEQKKKEEHKDQDQEKVYVLKDCQEKQEEQKNSIVIQNENNYSTNVEVRRKGNKPAEHLTSAAQTVEGQGLQATYFANEFSEVFESNLATLLEEEVILESPPDNFLQTATTCLIPVPVYECSAQEWNLENPLQELVDVTADEFGIYSNSVDSRTPMALKDVTEQNDNEQYVKEIVPIISVSQHTRENVEIDSKEIPHHSGHHTNQLLFDVKKRDSHVDMEAGSENRSSLDCSLQRYFSNADEKKRKDKSKRRVGIYIENADWAKAPEVTSSTDMGLNISLGNCSVIKTNQIDDCPLVNSLYSSDIEEIQTPESMYPYGLITFESEGNKSQAGREEQRQTNLLCQSSEEKEESNLVSQQNHQCRFFPCSESISDNENDRNLLSSRDRLSPSPALSDQDYKRYSKRPPRGPYGQMLEAEMKKPNRLHFEEMFDELKNPESSGRRNQGDNTQNISHDENTPKYSNSFCGRKSNTHLPIPTHTRAASTPSQMENISEASSLSKINSLDKRYQSNFDNSVRSNIKYYTDVKTVTSEAASSRPSHKRSSSLLSSEKEIKQNSGGNRILQTNRLPICENADSKHKARSDYTKDLLPTTKLLAELLQGASEKLVSEQHQQKCADTRTHVVQEIFRNEQSYVESLQTVVLKYFRVLKMPEYAGMIDCRTVDEIFFMVPDILTIHEKFLSELKSRLDSWEPQQKVGDAFIETFSKTEVLEVYTSFVNNCNRAKNAIRTTKHSRPSFARFLETTAREHKGKLTLDNLLIKPVQKFPNYEMLFTRLIKHTDADHPDQKHLQEVLKLVHDILVHINCKEREILENGQREATLRELENIIEGINELIAPDRQFLIFDLVSMPSGQGARKERGFFLFNDLLVITSIKRRSGTIRKPNTILCPGSVASTLDTNKYKFLTKVSLDNLEIIKPKDENLRRIVNEIEQLAEDCNKLQQIAEITATVKYPHHILEDVIRDLHRDVQRQLSDRQSNDAHLNMLEMTVNYPNGSQKLSIIFNKSEKRSQWEEAFNAAKQKLAATLERHPIPEFMTSIPIVKTRAGLQFTCAAPTLSDQIDVWVCNSDGYVGQVCVMSLTPEPNVTSCNGVCNARILCLASVPACNESEHKENQSSSYYGTTTGDFQKRNSPNLNINNRDRTKKSSPSTSNNSIQLDSNSSSDDSEPETVSNKERIPSPPPISATGPLAAHHHQLQDSNSDESDGNQSTMWLGTEDGYIHVYNCTDTIRIKKNKLKIQHPSAVYSILYLDNRVFVSLANGDICVYLRDSGGWNTNSPLCISIGTVSSPVTKLLNVHGRLWCSIQGIIKVLDTKTLQVVNQIQISSDSKPITNMTVSSSYVWISIQNSAHIKCFHSNTHQLITEVNLAPAVNKMLSNCDDIIRQHKAACLRVTSLLSCKDLIWIGTSAGVLLTIPAHGFEKGSPNVVPTGVPHGHTGHVRFLTFVEIAPTKKNSSKLPDEETTSEYKNRRSSKHSKIKSEAGNILIISGGDGYEDFRNSGANSLSEIAGREDSTNHLLIWQI